jgi:hypothetical protein
MRSYATALLSFLEHPQVQTPAIPTAHVTPFKRMRTPLSTVTSPTALPQMTELVQCPSMIPVLKMLLTPTSATAFLIMASTKLTCQPLLLSTLSILRIVEIVCIFTRLNSHMHLILLTLQQPQLKRNPNKTKDYFHQEFSQQRHGTPYYEFPAHYGPARTYNTNTDTDNIPVYSHRHFKQHYGQARNYDSSAVTDDIRLPPPVHQKLCCQRHQEQENYLFFSATLFFKQQGRSFYQLQPIEYFLEHF